MSIRSMTVAFVTVVLAVGVLFAGSAATTSMEDSVSGYHQRIDRAADI